MSEDKSMKGTRLSPRSDADLRYAVEQAVDYRGDVTVELKDGTKIEGFLFNRDFAIAEPFVEYYPKAADSEKQRFLAATIAAIDFDGRDTADGRSWEAWVAKQENKTGS
ncbi:MAG: hypothetical protein V3W41_15420 [Planctomycetota bacterium]